MTEGHYAILKFLSTQSTGVLKDKFPNEINSMFGIRKLEAGGFYHEMEIVLKTHKKWIELRRGQSGYFLSEAGTTALQQEIAAKNSENFQSELQRDKLWYETQQARNMFEGYSTTKIVAWVGAIGAIGVLILELVKWLSKKP